MKQSDKYPAAKDGEADLPTPMKVYGLHPLVWIFIVVLGIALLVGYDHLEHADWQGLLG